MSSHSSLYPAASNFDRRNATSVSDVHRRLGAEEYLAGSWGRSHRQGEQRVLPPTKGFIMNDDRREQWSGSRREGNGRGRQGQAQGGRGALTGDDDMKEEGAAQQKKADAQREVLAKRRRPRRLAPRQRRAKPSSAVTRTSTREGRGHGRVGVRGFRARTRVVRGRSRRHRGDASPGAVSRRRPPGRRRYPGPRCDRACAGRTRCCVLPRALPDRCRLRGGGPGGRARVRVRRDTRGNRSGRLPRRPGRR